MRVRSKVIAAAAALVRDVVQKELKRVQGDELLDAKAFGRPRLRVLRSNPCQGVGAPTAAS